MQELTDNRLSPLETLNPIYRHLPYCVSFHEEGTGNNKVVHYEYHKTYPPYPWKANSGDHSKEDPRQFIEACVAAGLVQWETAEERKERERKEAKYVDPNIAYEEWKKRHANTKPMIQRMPEGD